MGKFILYYELVESLLSKKEIFNKFCKFRNKRRFVIYDLHIYINQEVNNGISKRN